MIIDSIICVAVMTTRLRARRLVDDGLLQAGQLGVTHLNAEVTTRHHHDVRGVDDTLQGW